MKRHATVFAIVTLATLFLLFNGLTVFAQEETALPLKKKTILPLKRICCIAGTYKGVHKAILSSTCPEPEKGTFTMEIKQEKGCGSKIWGTITDAAGVVMNLEGTVTAGPDKCCTLEAKAEKPGETVKFKAVLCKDSGKWVSKDGKYEHSNGCSGVFEIKQT